MKKTILLIDDELGFIEALKDALEYEGFRVLTANTATDALKILKKERVDLVTVDIMMPPGGSLESQVKSHRTGVVLCRTIRVNYPHIYVFCISVINDPATIMEVKKWDVTFFSKGEVPLRAVLDRIVTKLTGRVFYSSSDDKS